MKKGFFLLGFHFLQYFAVGLFAVFLALFIYREVFFFPENTDSVSPSVAYTDDGKTEMKAFTFWGDVNDTTNFAPYFREALRKELKVIFTEKDAEGNLKHKRSDGKQWNIYRDGLKVYTTINKEMQEHAEVALETHLMEMQPKFREQLKDGEQFPYRDLSKQQFNRSIWRSKKRSIRYSNLKAQGQSDKEIAENFNQPAKMKVFSWDGEIDTVMTPHDSVLYYKTFLRGGMMSMEPQTGFVKAWVGGADINHFAYDYVAQSKRQVGSLIKPFVYVTALSMSAVDPCETFSGGYCVGDWCPGGKAVGNMTSQLIASSSATTVAVMSKMGPLAGKENMAKLLSELDINLPRSQITPPMCLGTMSLSLKSIVSAYCSIINQGIYNSPSLIFRIEDRLGNIIYEADPKTKEVFSENVAFALVSMLKEGTNRGMSSRLRREKFGGIPYPTAAKTGTTQNNSDAWFIGMTPDLVTGVWAGGEERAIRWGWTGMGQGASAALPMYGYFMKSVYADTSIHITTGDFLRPKDFSQDWEDCITGKKWRKGDKGGEYYFYKEPEKSDEGNPFL